jgi:uncharacterized membrane protein YidH (DUF202 family)
MKTEQNPSHDQIILNEVQLLLAEKRTSLAVLRTGLAVITITISVLSVLIATSEYYHFSEVLPLLLPLMLILLILLFLGAYLVIRSFRKIRHFDQTIEHLKKKHSILSKII